MIPTALVEYDALADIYDGWSQADPAAEPTYQFYVDVCCAEPGAVVELGVGTGRIAVEVARRGKNLTGIDISGAMLDACRQKLREQGLTDKLCLIQADVCTFTLPAPASLIIFPFRSIGHLLSREEKLALLRNVRRNLEPGGRFLFDHYILDEAWARSRHGIPQLMCRLPQPDDTVRLVWDTYLFDFDSQRMACFILVEKLDAVGRISERVYHPLSFSWIHPGQMRALVEEAGLELNALYGDFEGSPFTNTSEQQVWVVKRPL